MMLLEVNYEMSQDLWGNLAKVTGSYFVYHDESLPNKQWLLIGLLFISTNHLESVLKSLMYFRDLENYYGEIHFSALAKSFNGEFGSKARVARHWIDCYQRGLYREVHCSILAVDKHSPAFEHHRFSRDFHSYNRFTAMALKAGIAWHLGPYGYDEIEISFISDNKDRTSRPDKGIIDNFNDYIPYRAELDCMIAREECKKYPKVQMTLELRDSDEDDILQLIDLILGATQQALVAGSNSPTKCELGEFICNWCHDLSKVPWEQEIGLHRKFSFWAFPDGEGKPYSFPSLALEHRDNITLF